MIRHQNQSFFRQTEGAEDSGGKYFIFRNGGQQCADKERLENILVSSQIRSFHRGGGTGMNNPDIFENLFIGPNAS